MARLTGDERREITSDFRRLVNMAPRQLERWLDSEASRTVGQKSSDGAESVGHRSGRRIIEIKRTKVADRTDDDLRHMRKVNGYIGRHLAQRPDGDITDTP